MLSQQCDAGGRRSGRIIGLTLEISSAKTVPLRGGLETTRSLRSSLSILPVQTTVSELRYFRIIDAFPRGKILSPHRQLGGPVWREGHSIPQNLRHTGFGKFPAVPAGEPCQVGRLSARRQKQPSSLKIVSATDRAVPSVKLSTAGHIRTFFRRQILSWQRQDK